MTKTTQKDLEGKEKEKNAMELGGGILLSCEIKDIISHDKNSSKTITLFANIMNKGVRVATANININNIKADGMTAITGALGSKPTLNTPLLTKIFIPEGALLEHWTQERPKKEDKDEE